MKIDFNSNKRNFIFLVTTVVLLIIAVIIMMVVFPVNGKTTYKTYVLERQSNALERREFLWEYLKNDIELPEGKGVYGHIKIEEFDTGVFLGYFDILFFYHLNEVIDMVGEQYDINSAISAVPDSHLFLKAFMKPGYQQQEDELKPQLTDEAYKDDELIHVVFYDLDFDKLSTTIMYDSGLYLIVEPITDEVEEITVADTVYTENVTLNTTEALYLVFTGRDSGGETSRRISWYHEEEGQYQRITIGDDWSKPIAKDELLSIALRIEENYHIAMK